MLKIYVQGQEAGRHYLRHINNTNWVKKKNRHKSKQVRIRKHQELMTRDSGKQVGVHELESKKNPKTRKYCKKAQCKCETAVR